MTNGWVWSWSNNGSSWRNLKSLIKCHLQVIPYREEDKLEDMELVRYRIIEDVCSNIKGNQFKHSSNNYHYRDVTFIEQLNTKEEDLSSI